MSAPLGKRIMTDDYGHVVLLADVPNAGGVVLRKTTSTTGNKAHDSASGKFTKTGAKPEKRRAEPNADPAEMERMLSAARDAAREFDDFDEGDIREFLKGRARDHSAVDLDQFIALVRRQRISDLSDLLDQQLRSTGSMKQGRRKVRITAPKGFLRKALKGITPEESTIILHSLVSRGHSEEEAKQFLASKNLGDVQFSDDVEYSDEPSELLQFVDAVRSQPTAAELTASMVEALGAMPAPQVNVTIPEPKPRSLNVVRGPNGLIESVKDE